MNKTTLTAAVLLLGVAAFATTPAMARHHRHHRHHHGHMHGHMGHKGHMMDHGATGGDHMGGDHPAGDAMGK